MRSIAGLIFSMFVLSGIMAQDVPKIISTFPANVSKNVNPNTSDIWVKFDRAMQDGSWSWAYTEKSRFPKVNGQAKYTEGNTKNILPVKLFPNTEYEIWLNTKNLRDFKSEQGIPLKPYLLKFRTAP